MKAQFRPTTRADAPAIAEFLGRIFDAGPGQPIVDRDMMEWKYWRERPGWSGSRSYVLERDGAIVAHGAAWPARILAPQEIPCFFLIDWAASPDFPGAGVSVMKHMAQIVPVNFLFGGTEVACKMRFAMGYRPRNDVLTLALPLRPFRQILTSRRWNWRTPARLARNLAWSLKSRPAAHWTARAVGPTGIAGAGLHWPGATPGTLAVQRNPELFECLLGCPGAPVSFCLAFRGAQLMGYFCLVFPPGQARIADAWIDSDRTEDWIELYALVLEQAPARSGVNEVVAGATRTAAVAALEGLGFHLRSRDPVQLYDPQKLVPPDLPLEAQLIDGDAAFRYAPGAGYLT